MTLSAAIGFIMVLVLVYCLISKKLLPAVAFVLFPTLAALLVDLTFLKSVSLPLLVFPRWYLPSHSLYSPYLSFL